LAEASGGARQAKQSRGKSGLAKNAASGEDRLARAIHPGSAGSGATFGWPSVFMVSGVEILLSSRRVQHGGQQSVTTRYGEAIFLTVALR